MAVVRVTIELAVKLVLYDTGSIALKLEGWESVFTADYPKWHFRYKSFTK